MSACILKINNQIDQIFILTLCFQYIVKLIQDYIKLMLGLKLNVAHSHHAPCHPTRAHLEYIQQSSCITQTDRQQLSDQDKIDHIKDKKSVRSSLHEYKTLQMRPSRDLKEVQQISLNKKRKIPQKLTSEQIYHTNVIEQSLRQSTKEVPFHIRELIKQKQKLVEDKVYLGIFDKGSNLLERIYESIDDQTHLKDCIQQNLTNLMSSIQSNLEQDINDHKYFIHRIQYFTLKQIRSTRGDLIKNRRRRSYDQNSITSNGMTFHTSQTGENNLTSKDESQSYVSQSHISQQDFSLKSEQTKKAQQFIKKIQKEQIQQRIKRKQQEQRIKSLQVKSMQEKKQFEEQIKTERKNYLKRRIQAKKQIKQKELQIREKMNKEYHQFLKKYKKGKPLFKQKEEKYLKFEEQERKKQMSFLDKLKEERRSISISQILDHEQKYKNYKKQKQMQKVNEDKINFKSQTPLKNYYRAKIFDVLQQEEEKDKQKQIKEDPKYVRSQLIKKRDLYAKHVRDVHLPKGDEAKQNQLRQLIQKLQWAQKLKNGKLDPKERNQAGNQYLRRIHELISELRSKNKLPHISKSIDYDQIQNSTRPFYKNYLQELKLNRRRYSIDYDQLADTNFQDIQFRAHKLERNAKRRQTYIIGNSFNIQRTLQENKRVDDQYLQAVKAKMALLNKFD